MKKINILLLYCCIAILATIGFLINQKIEAYSSKVTHPLLTQKIAELYNYIYEPDLTDEEVQLLMDGSKKEDTAPRWINHFYDPTTGLGWFGKRLGDISQEDVMTAAILAFGKEPVSVIDWAQDQDLQNSQYSLYQGNRTFDSAVLYYLEGKEQEAYYTLGYVLHLIEDMAVPAHTRQDTHFDMAPGIFEQILGVKLDRGEPYEKWVEENGDIDQNAMNILKNNYQPICSSLESCLIYLANYSNKDFFSQDSVLDKDYYNPKVLRYVPISGDVVYAYGEDNRLLFISERDRYEGETKYTFDNQIYWDHLSPVAILAGVEVVKYFHDQAEKAKNNEITLTRPTKLSFLKKIQTISTYGEFARLWKLASFASVNPFALLWGNDDQEDETQPISQSPNVLNDLGLTYGEAQERMDDLQELLDLLNNKDDSFSWPSFEPPSLSLPEPFSFEPPSLELPSLENPLSELPPLLQIPPETQPRPPAVVTVTPAGSGNQTVYPKVLISEIQILPTDARFIELYNPNSSEVNLTDWYIQRKTATGSDWNSFVSSTKFEGKVIPSKGYFLISRQIGGSDILSDITLSDNNSLILKNPNREIVDKIGWGQAQEFESTPIVNPSNGESIGRKWVSNTEQDTDNNSVDFETQNPTPKAKNGFSILPPPPPPPSPPAPPTTDTVAPSMIFNLNPTQESLNFSINFEITDLSVENVSPSGLATFQFRWKQSETGDWQEDISQEIVGHPTSHNLIREFAGEDEKTYYFQVKAKDINNNESVWLPETPAETKISIPKTILINEIQTEGKTTKDEFIELYNPNNVDVDLLKFTLKKKTSGGTESNLVSSSSFFGTIPALGYFLIVPQINDDGTLNYTGLTTPDLYYSGKTYSFASDNTILLYNNFGNLLDKVGFGLAKDFEGSPALNPPESKSIERKGIGRDTNDNSVDFRISAEPTPKSGSPKVYIQFGGDYSGCGSSGCSLTINWHSPSTDIDYYQVQYELNNGKWKDWFLQTTDAQGVFNASSSMFTDHIYYFRARAKDLEGNFGSWSSELKIDISNPIVINEIALFGTNAGRDDQWIELYNKSDKDIDLTGWKFVTSGSGYNYPNINISGIIPAKGYFIIEKNDEQAISTITANSIFTSILGRSYLVLVNKEGRKVDNFYFPFSNWQEYNFKKEDGNYYSMERISPYSFGYDYRNWLINDGLKINGLDREGNPIYGTPGQQNSNYQLYTLLSVSFIEDTVLPKSVDGITTSPYILASIITVFPDVTLTIEPGVVIKSWGEIYPSPNGLSVKGTLKAIGTAEEPIIFTSRYPESENPGGWHGIRFEGEKSNNSELKYVIVQYAGAMSSSTLGDNGFLAGIRVENTSISLKNSTIETNLYNGLYLINSSSVIDNIEVRNNKYALYGESVGAGIKVIGGSPTIKNSRITDNYYGLYIEHWYDPEKMIEIPATPIIENNIFEQNSYPIWLGELASPSFINNQAVNNESNGIVIVGDVKEDTIWAATDLPYIIKNNLNVLSDAVLTIEPGVIVKFSDSALIIQGTLKAVGIDYPIIFTSNSDQPEPGQWKGIYFTETSLDSKLENVQVRYGAGIKVDQSVISLRNSTIERNTNNGLWLINSLSIIDSVQVLDNQWTTYSYSEGRGVRIDGGSPTITNSNIARNHYGLYLSDWYDENGNPISATPIIENTDYSDNDIMIWPLVP